MIGDTIDYRTDRPISIPSQNFSRNIKTNDLDIGRKIVFVKPHLNEHPDPRRKRQNYDSMTRLFFF